MFVIDFGLQRQLVSMTHLQSSFQMRGTSCTTRFVKGLGGNSPLRRPILPDPRNPPDPSQMVSIFPDVTNIVYL